MFRHTLACVAVVLSSLLACGASAVPPSAEQLAAWRSGVPLDPRQSLAAPLAGLQLSPTALTAGGRTDALWQLLSGPVDPPQSANVRAIHDARRHRMVLVNGDNFGELWQSTLPATGRIDWKRVPVRGADFPRGRFGFSTVHDAARDRVILFGGNTWAGGLNDTWSLSLGDSPEWTRIDVGGQIPAERGMHVAVLDLVRDRMVMFGGFVVLDTAEQYFNDTWALDLRGSPVWTRLSTTGPQPMARRSASAVYDPWNDRMVVFGGWNQLLQWPQIPIFDDTWALSLAGNGQWSPLAVPVPPPARHEHVAVVDPIRRTMIVSGGNEWQWRYINDTWELPLDGPTSPSWVQLVTEGDNPRVGNHAAMFSPERGTLIQFGGAGAGNEHFELDPNSRRWSAINANVPETFPRRRAAATLMPSPDGTHLLMLGGTYYDCPNDLWRFELQPPGGWRPLAVS